jgi:hypothetical protein
MWLIERGEDFAEVDRAIHGFAAETVGRSDNLPSVPATARQ